MKAIILLCTISFFSTALSSQQPKKMVYLVLTIEGERDRMNQRDFFRISAEPFNIYASEIYRLVRFRNKGLFTNTTNHPIEPASFWMNRTDTTTIFYNYFQNTTEALMYLGEQGWELISINNAIISSYGTTVHSKPYTKISSTPVFYFKREIISPVY